MTKKRIRSTAERINELNQWIKDHPDADKYEFMKATGGSANQFYHARKSAGLPLLSTVLSDAMKKAYKRKVKAKQKTITLIVPKTNESKVDVKAVIKNTEEFAKPTEVVAEGNTPDFIWYEIDLIQRKLSDISTRLAHVMKVSQARDADQKKMMRDLITENTELRVNNSSLIQQVSELTEMINGTPV